MGRGKIEIKRIENSSIRQVTYSKRRNGIMKKDKEINVLCDAQVFVIIFANTAKMHEFCSPSTTLVDVLDQYHKLSGKRLWDTKHQNEMVEEENQNLLYKLRQMHLDPMEECVIEAQGVYDHHRVADYEAQQVPFSFRVQPMQPNRHERF